jgi:phenylalanyl-tRNA synthetase beta subunit
MKRLIVLAVALILGLNVGVFSQEKGVAKVIVLPEHEKNFNKLIKWLEESAIFKGKKSFISSIIETFNFAKAGNLEGYMRSLSVYRTELEKLDSLELSELINFSLSSLTPVKSKEVLPAEVPGCEADCLLTSCKITCPTGKKPKCQCHFFFADCGCEPYR